MSKNPKEGVDPAGAFDWATAMQFLMKLLEFLNKRQPARAAGHHDPAADCCREAARLALESARVSLEHLSHCEGG